MWFCRHVLPQPEMRCQARVPEHAALCCCVLRCEHVEKNTGHKGDHLPAGGRKKQETTLYRRNATETHGEGDYQFHLSVSLLPHSAGCAWAVRELEKILTSSSSRRADHKRCERSHCKGLLSWRRFIIISHSGLSVSRGQRGNAFLLLHMRHQFIHFYKGIAVPMQLLNNAGKGLHRLRTRAATVM